MNYNARPDGAWVVLIVRSPDPEETSLVGLFRTPEDAQGYIEEAHDLADEPCSPEDHMDVEDVPYASVAYINMIAS